MQNYPLSWPAGWRRTESLKRRSANFKRNRDKVTVAEGAARVLRQLAMFGVRAGDSIISTNVEPRLDGIPRSDRAQPKDPGAAVYWKLATDKTHKVMAIDIYDRVADNLAAVAATLDAMRAIERHGGAMILERAFIGFVALPEPNNWRHVLGLTDETSTLAKAEDAYKRLAKTRHPDAGGSHEQMAAINLAYEQAKRELSS